jgi:hypothetical protein
MFSGEIGSLQPRTSYAVARTIGSREMGCTRLHDASIKTQSKQRRLPLIFLGLLHAFGRRTHLSFRGRRHGGREPGWCWRLGDRFKQRRSMATPDRAEIGFGPSRHHLGERLRPALDRNVNRSDAGTGAESLGGQMGGGAGAGRGVVERAGLRSRGGDEVGDRPEALGRRGHQDGRHAAERDDGGKVARRIIG